MHYAAYSVKFTTAFMGLPLHLPVPEWFNFPYVDCFFVSECVCSGVLRNLKREDRGYISSVHFHKCSNFSLSFSFTSNIIANVCPPANGRGGVGASPPLLPKYAPVCSGVVRIWYEGRRESPSQRK